MKRYEVIMNQSIIRHGWFWCHFDASKYIQKAHASPMLLDISEHLCSFQSCEEQQCAYVLPQPCGDMLRPWRVEWPKRCGFDPMSYLWVTYEFWSQIPQELSAGKDTESVYAWCATCCHSLSLVAPRRCSEVDSNNNWSQPNPLHCRPLQPTSTALRASMTDRRLWFLAPDAQRLLKR